MWVGDMAQAPFDAAVNSPVLHEAFDLLVGEGRWTPRHSLGTFPLRFPHTEEPDDAGWHGGAPAICRRARAGTSPTCARGTARC